MGLSGGGGTWGTRKACFASTTSGHLTSITSVSLLWKTSQKYGQS